MVGFASGVGWGDAGTTPRGFGGFHMREADRCQEGSDLLPREPGRGPPELDRLVREQPTFVAREPAGGYAVPPTVPPTAHPTAHPAAQPASQPAASPLRVSAETWGGLPGSEDEVVEALGEEICTLAAHISAATQRLLELLAEFDRRGGWKAGGHRSCAHWLHFRTGIDLGACREKVRVARALEGLPETRASMGRGELSFSKVRALTRVAKEETEAELVPIARKLTAAELERVVRSWSEVDRGGDEAEVERRRHARRSLAVAPDGAGMYVVRGCLTPEVGALLMRAVEAASDALFRPGETWGAAGGQRGPAGMEVTPRQRRADALGLLAERALAAGFGGKGEVEEEVVEAEVGAEMAEEETGASGVPGSVTEAPGPAPAPRMAEPPEPSDLPDPPLSGTRAERYQVFLHVEPETLAKEGGSESHAGRENPGGSEHHPGGCRHHAGPDHHAGPEHHAGPGNLPGSGPRSFLEDGTRVSAETSRRLCCDAAVVRVRRGRGGSVLDVGRRTRTIPPALRRALEVRDGGCRFPGCGLRFTEGHHIVHWGDGGETRLSNLVLLCRFHHRAVHEEGFRVRMERDGRTVRFFDPLGWPLPDMAPPPKRPAGDLVTELVQANRARGADPDGDTQCAKWTSAEDMPRVIRGILDEAILQGLE
jgi:hypothetical protein